MVAGDELVSALFLEASSESRRKQRCRRKKAASICSEPFLR